MHTKNRLCASLFATIIHLSVSLLIGAAIFFVVFKAWFPHPLDELSGGRTLFALLIGSHIVCGPFLTSILFNPKKTKRELSLDLLLIIFLQLSILGCNLYFISRARPVVIAFEADRFVVVSAVDVDIEDLPNAESKWRSLSWSGPILLGTRVSTDGTETLRSIALSLAGLEPSGRPSWWQEYNKSRPTIIKTMKPLSALMLTSKITQQDILDNSLQNLDVSYEKIYYLPLVSKKHLDSWVVLLNDQADIIGYAPVGGFQ